MIKSNSWLLINRYPEALKKYEEYTSIITNEKVEIAIANLNEKDYEVLRVISEMKIITSMQLSRYVFQHTRNPLKHTNDSLKKLYELGCIDRFFPLVPETKGLDYVHVVLGPVGARVLKVERFRRMKNLNQNWRHTVANNEVLSKLHLRYKIKHYTKELKLLWKDEAEREKKIQSDIFLIYRKEKQEKYSFIEVDMGTETVATLINKVKKYEEYVNTMDFKRASWQPYKKDNIAILPEIWFIMNDQKNATKLKTKLNKLQLNNIYKVVMMESL